MQETWLGVLNGLDRFEGRASLKTWIFRILTNRALSRAEREGAHDPVSSCASSRAAVDPDRFRPEGDPYAGGWKSFPASWDAPARRSGCSRARRSRSSARRSRSCPSASTS